VGLEVKPKKSPRERLVANCKPKTVVVAGPEEGIVLSRERVLLLVVVL
jgi:hypothetical protein